MAAQRETAYKACSLLSFPFTAPHPSVLHISLSLPGEEVEGRRKGLRLKVVSGCWWRGGGYEDRREKRMSEGW